ncbi:hypothetical protein BDK89_2546 [Ilumatobacter fluminis]|uniref:Uncharacterized protein n=1 Tax=Ilumatobacter fluminis TaxID=467091 RepID=A0A4R7I0L7_9ACTN|nr:hypothetical protein [Ilumatobacter fluminis]TDT16945.1 hypothetical protein BDK89_2546 [Ilumatobacter fluminis]
MAFVNKSGGDGEETSTDVAAGAPPHPDFDFDPNDPDQVKVHYDLAGWSIDQRAELAETLAENAVPHVWEDDELVIPEHLEGPVDQLFEQLEAEIGPFPVVLGDDDAATEFGLDEWKRADLLSLQQALVEAEIPHRWHDTTLFVATDAEHVVDDLLDAIEAGEVASLDEDTEAPDGALHALYSAADKLRRDPTHGSSRDSLLALVPRLSPSAPPFGMAGGPWATMVGAATALVATFENGRPTDEIKEAANALHGVCRDWV